MILIQTYLIEDCWRYAPTEYNNIQTPNWSLPQGNFEITWESLPITGHGSRFPQLGIGTDTNNLIYIGQGDNVGKTTFVYKCNGTNQEVLTGTHLATDNAWNDYKYTYINGTHTLETLGDTLTSTKSCVLLSNVVQIYNQNSKIKNIKIKPL